MNSKLKYPIYIPSKGRYEYMITSHALSDLGLNHFIIVEPQEVALYERAINSSKKLSKYVQILELDMTFKERYETCDNLGLTKSTGSGPARNFAWEHSRLILKTSRHWIMDDNIKHFGRVETNSRYKVNTSAIFNAMEDFTDRYTNIALSGPNYNFFVIAKSNKLPPFWINSWNYSCILIKNDIKQRWRGRYNEDVILGLDCLKDGLCTIRFNAFMQYKMGTQKLKGGNTSELYQADGHKNLNKAGYSKSGTSAKSEMLARVHPDVAKVVYRYNRWHHWVDYRPFKKNKLIKFNNLQIDTTPNNYGMILRKK